MLISIQCDRGTNSLTVTSVVTHVDLHVLTFFGFRTVTALKLSKAKKSRKSYTKSETSFKT